MYFFQSRNNLGREEDFPASLAINESVVKLVHGVGRLKQ